MISLLVLIGGTLTIVLGEPVRVREPVKVVGQVGQQTTTLSCALPQSWSKCTFVKHSGDRQVPSSVSQTLCLFGVIFYSCPFQASCEIDNGEQSTQSCFEFNVNNSKSWLYIDRDNEPPRCFVQISDLQREHNGTYSCFFENALTLSRTLESEDKTSDMHKKMDAPHRLPHPLSSNHFRIPSSPVKHFTLTVLIWPSGILVSALMYINANRTFLCNLPSGSSSLISQKLEELFSQPFLSGAKIRLLFRDCMIHENVMLFCRAKVFL